MKKTFLIALISALAITMTACGKIEEDTESKSETTAATAETTVTTTVSEETETTTSTGTSATTSKTSTTRKATTKKNTAKSSSVNNSNGSSNDNVGNSCNNNNAGQSVQNNSSNGNNGGSYNNNNNQSQQTQTPATTTKEQSTAKKPVQTTQAVQQNRLTQGDMDRLKAELQEYSSSKAVYLQEHYSECLRFDGQNWVSWSSFEELVQNEINKLNPNNSSYDDIVTITYDSPEQYSDIISYMKNYIDYGYQKRPDGHYVVYVENCPNGTSYGGGRFGPCWNIYLLY